MIGETPSRQPSKSCPTADSIWRATVDHGIESAMRQREQFASGNFDAVGLPPGPS